MAAMDDGTVLPSFLGVDFSEGSTEPHSFFGNVTLMAGEVESIRYPNDENSRSKSEVEYIVRVWERASSGALDRVTIRCRQSDSFGSLADHFRFSLRPASKLERDRSLNNGATVLVACPNGDRSQATIVCALKNPRAEKDPGRPDKSQPHVFLDFLFNGVHAEVNNEGEFKLTTQGATTVDGAPSSERDENQHGSNVQMLKDGTVIVSDENGESIRISPKDKLIEVLAGDYKVHAEKNIVLDADGKTYIGAEGASENLVLGKQMVAMMNDLVTLLSGVIGTGNLGIPVPAHPAFKAGLEVLKARYLTSKAVLSKDKFTQ